MKKKTKDLAGTKKVDLSTPKIEKKIINFC